MRVIIFTLFLLLSTQAFAVQPDEMLKDPALEQRARDISKNLRCLVCQGEDIDESNAPLAGDLRRLVRQRLSLGDTNDEVLSFVQKRYGDYVLMTPPLKTSTVFLWFGPLLILCGGIVVVLRRAGLRHP
jgi:cytochrome c-type biogenesis protein CcmH